jgi:hypothetical protein
MISEPEDMTYDEYIQKQNSGVCLPSRKSYETIKSFLKYENMFEVSEGYSGCENSEYRKEWFSDEFVNCKFCSFAKNSLKETPCRSCNGNFLKLPHSNKMVGVNFALRNEGFEPIKKKPTYFMHNDCLKMLRKKKEVV